CAREGGTEYFDVW
nr:immunoglobulin heavy chain junction region [Mus musculus]